MRCCHPWKKEVNGVITTLPCGNCMACRLNHARMWSIRIVHEASLYANNVFLTLTYDDEHLPENGTLVKRDLQLFMKRFRKCVGKVRYYACGEYGDKFGRPHYHLVVFGIGLDDPVFKDKKYDKKSNGYHCKLASWDKGLVHIGTVTVDSANYVAGYVVKKFKGKGAKEHYDELGVIPEFVLMSRRPGIGADFFGDTPCVMAISDFVGVKEKSMLCLDFIKRGCRKMYGESLKNIVSPIGFMRHLEDIVQKIRESFPGRYFVKSKEISFNEILKLCKKLEEEERSET